jgi:hypothetical protein
MQRSGRRRKKRKKKKRLHCEPPMQSVQWQTREARHRGSM